MGMGSIAYPAATAQDIIATRNANLAAGGQMQGGKYGTVTGTTPQQDAFARAYVAAHPGASDADIRRAGYQAGVWATPEAMGDWGLLATQVLPMALSLASLSGGPLSGLLSGITGGGGAAAGGAASAIPAAAGDIVVTAPASASLGGLGAAGLGGGAVSQALSHNAGGTSSATQAHNVAPTVPAGPTDIVVTSNANRPATMNPAPVAPPVVTTQPDINVTANRPSSDAPLPPAGAHTPGGSGGGSPSAVHETPAPSSSPPTSFPWKQLLKMIPGSAQAVGSGAAPASSPTMANKTAASPFGGGTGAGASINIQGANRPSIYPWVAPGVTSSGQVQQDQDGGYYG